MSKLGQLAHSKILRVFGKNLADLGIPGLGMLGRHLYKKGYFLKRVYNQRELDEMYQKHYYTPRMKVKNWQPDKNYYAFLAFRHLVDTYGERKKYIEMHGWNTDYTKYLRK